MTNPEVNKNIFSNILGKVWVGIVGIIFLPLYIKYLGKEAYGLVGFYTSMLMVFAVFDFGLSTTLNRELARISSLNNSLKDAKDLIRTFEMVYWLIGLLIGFGFFFLAPSIAHYWLTQNETLSSTQILHALQIMGVVIIFQWPITLYSAGFSGLQKQVQLNWIRFIFSSLQSIGAVFILHFISSSVLSYFLWQMLVFFLYSITLGFALWSRIPKTNQSAHFNKTILIQHWGFSLGMTGITFLSIFLTQLDKIIISKLLSLETLGTYTLITTIGGTLSFIVGPIFNAIFPKLTQLASQNDELQKSKIYHHHCQLVSVLSFSLWIIFFLFSKEILLIFFNNHLSSSETVQTLKVFSTGTLLNALMILPLALQLAHGFTKLSFYKNIVAVIIFTPLMYFMISRYQMLGAAGMWFLVNFSYLIFEIPIMHRYFLKGEMKLWYFIDVGIPLLASLMLGFFFKVFIPIPHSKILLTFYLASVFLLSLVTSAIAAPSLRQKLLKK